jgi:hypothetical protein
VTRVVQAVVSDSTDGPKVGLSVGMTSSPAGLQAVSKKSSVMDKDSNRRVIPKISNAAMYVEIIAEILKIGEESQIKFVGFGHV